MNTEEIKELGFLPEESNGWYSYDGGKFNIEFNPYEKPCFYIYTFMSGDKESAPHPYISKEKLEVLINAYKEYFK